MITFFIIASNCYRYLSEDESVKKQLCPQESDDVPSRAIPLKGVDDDLPHPVIFEEGKEVYSYCGHSQASNILIYSALNKLKHQKGFH